MEPHVHMSAVHALFILAIIVAMFGTLHLLALGTDSRWGRAFMALGF
jgi:hypothetical protein